MLAFRAFNACDRQRLRNTRFLTAVLWRSFTAVGDSVASVPLTNATFQVWGANTGVGKSLLSAGLLRKAGERAKVLYLKPVQTGFPEDSDARLTAAVSALTPTLGEHAAELVGEPARHPDYAASVVHTEYAWRQAVSPHLAVETEGRAVADGDIRQAALRHLTAFAEAHQSRSESPLALIETAGGPASPGPSGRLQSPYFPEKGTPHNGGQVEEGMEACLRVSPRSASAIWSITIILQCDIYRSLRMPALLVGDGRLGGISGTLAAHEMLSHRGYDVTAVALLEADGGPNAAALRRHLGEGPGHPTPVFQLPTCHEASERPTGATGQVDADLEEWLGASDVQLLDLLTHLRGWHQDRVSVMKRLAGRTLQQVWYPFTQHRGLQERDITVIDARAGDELLVFKEAGANGVADRIEPHFDACASWWTQGVNDELHPKLVSETFKGVARYGHVMHPNAAIQPTLHLADLLLGSVGKGWASRVFYSDDGSTAVEVALKMAFRKFWRDHPEVDLHGSDGRPPCELKVVGIDGGYHGDTLGAMDAVAPSVYNGPAQFPWYKGRGLFLTAPYVGITKGKWRIQGSREGALRQSWDGFSDLLDPARQTSEAAERYREEINSAIDRFEAASQQHGARAKVAACIVEPVLQGAGGMLLVEPLFQSCLVGICRQRKIPVIFDEVFTGIWRLGALSAADILGLQPDIACYAKLLTGGLLPLSATLASDEVFRAFDGDSKLEALLHGHSYSGHAAGASAGAAALAIFSRPDLNPALLPDGSRLKELWPVDLVTRLSHKPSVEYVVPIGTVLAVELSAEDGGGYASGASAVVVRRLREKGIFARPLGSVVYLMVTPTTRPEKAASLLQSLLDVLEESEGVHSAAFQTMY